MCVSFKGNLVVNYFYDPKECGLTIFVTLNVELDVVFYSCVFVYTYYECISRSKVQNVMIRFVECGCDGWHYEFIEGFAKR